MANNEFKQQKEFYKKHLEFLGYNIDENTDDEQEFVAIKGSYNTFCRVFTRGIRLSQVYGTTQYAENNREELLEFINDLNGKGLAKYYTSRDGGGFAIEMFLFSPYEKINFGNFVDLFFKEIARIGDDPNINKYLL